MLLNMRLMNDNRNYIYAIDENAVFRPEYKIIESWMIEGARVIDLGCGDGSLLALLKEKKKISELGIDIAESGVSSCLRKGINARTGRIDVKLEDISDDSFDFAICNVTLQMVMYPEVMLREMKRIAKFQVISFPNFGFILNRLDMLIYGRMPRTMLSNYHWYNTGHIHQLSISDFINTINKLGLRVIKSNTFARRKFLRYLSFVSANLFSPAPIFLLGKAPE